MRIISVNVVITLMGMAVLMGCKARFSPQPIRPDSLYLGRQFLNICNHYQQLPLQATIEVMAVSNYISNASDTGRSLMEIRISECKTYTRMGEVEELSNDSLLLLVNHDANQMVLYANRSLIRGQIERQAKGTIWADSSVQKFVGTFSVSQSTDDKLVADSRILLNGSTFPSESIAIWFDKKRLEPREVVQTKRKWVAIGVSNYVRLKDLPAWKGKLRTESPNRYYLMKEQGMVYRYREIGHKEGIPLERIDKWVKKNGDGKYEIAKGYEYFHLTVNP